jgi:hypothetical protein
MNWKWAVNRVIIDVDDDDDNDDDDDDGYGNNQMMGTFISGH